MRSSRSSSHEPARPAARARDAIAARCPIRLARRDRGRRLDVACAAQQGRRRPTTTPPDPPRATLWPPPPWPDTAIHRFLDVRPERALAAATELWPDVAQTGTAECRVPAALHFHRIGRGVQVELVIAPWTRSTTEVRLELRTLRVPPGYFDAAHNVADTVSAALLERARAGCAFSNVSSASFR